MLQNMKAGRKPDASHKSTSSRSLVYLKRQSIKIADAGANVVGLEHYLHVMLHNMLYEPGHGVVGPGDGHKRQKEVDAGVR